MQMKELWFTSWDGSLLFYRAWVPDKPASQAVLLFHRGHEHSARFEETVTHLDLQDAAYFAWDQRGHGRSPGERGHAASVSVLAKDCDWFVRHIRTTHSIAIDKIVVIASSLGAVIATAWVHDFGPAIAGMVLAAPAFRVKLYVPFAIIGLRVLHKVLPHSKIKSYVRSAVLTHDSGQARLYDADPLIFRQISVGLLLDLYDTSNRIMADASAIQTPTLVLVADRDWVVELGAQLKFFKRVGSSFKQLRVFSNTYHSLFHEVNRREIADQARVFIQACFKLPDGSQSLIDADQSGFGRTEYDLLCAPGPMRWTFVRGSLKAMGYLSNGIRLGKQTGFDSGMTLDYVYENRARGVTPLGRLIDYFYLNAIGWCGIRVRRENLQRSLRDVIKRVQLAGDPVRILDIASGPGRYVLETLQALGDPSASALLRDYQQPNLNAGRKLADAFQLQNISFELGDAFDRAGLASVEPGPTIAIASGIYELFPDNDPVMQSLQGIADAMNEGGFLIYTCQPWHPQVEFIARALTNREGKPWIMRRRNQAEMDALVKTAGFEKIEQDIDRWGIFTVSIARRLPK